MSAENQAAASQAGKPDLQVETTTPLLDDILGRAKVKPTDRQQAQDLIDNLIGEALKGTVTWDKNVTQTIKAGMQAIEEALSKQLAAILHDPKFQKLEGSWRGLHHLIMNSNTSATLKIKVLNVSKRELFRDVDRAVEFDQSQVFKKLYENEFGTPGGEPYGSLIGDYEFSNHPEDMELLTKMSQVSAAAFSA